MEETITAIINEFGSQLLLGFVTLFVTGFILLAVKNLIQTVLNYVSVRMSDIGFGAMIKWEGQLKRVVGITFRKIKVIDDEEIIFIPIDKWLKSSQTYPQPRYDSFDEKKWATNPWDGKDRRKDKGRPITKSEVTHQKNIQEEHT